MCSAIVGTYKADIDPVTVHHIAEFGGEAKPCWTLPRPDGGQSVGDVGLPLHFKHGAAQAGITMSESSSDTDSSPWTVISNEGSDIEMLGLEDGGDGGESHSDSPHSTEEAQDQDETAVPNVAETYQHEEAVEKIQADEKVGVEVLADEPVTQGSMNDFSDKATREQPRRTELGTLAGPKTEGVDPDGGESHLHSVNVAQTRVFPVASSVGSSSSSEEEWRGQLPGLFIRKRRIKFTGTSGCSEGEGLTAGKPELPKPGQKEMQQQEMEREDPGVTTPMHGIFRSTLYTYFLLTLVITLSLGLGYLYGTFQVKMIQNFVERPRVEDLVDAGGDLHSCEMDKVVIAENKEGIWCVPDELKEKPGRASPLADIMEKKITESIKLTVSQRKPQNMKLRQTAEERGNTEENPEHLARKSRQLKNSLECEEKSVSTLQDELRNLRAQIRNLEWKGVNTDFKLQENQEGKDHIQEENQQMVSFLVLKEALLAEARVLRRELDREWRVTNLLMEELGDMGSGKMDIREIEELQTRLVELERKLNFEQQRSDLWERLYMEATDKRMTVDKHSTMDKVKDIVHATENSTKELVRHQEQIKKAKEETFRKFPDPVNPLFRYYKDSAKNFFGKDEWHHMRRPYERRDARVEHCEQREMCAEHRGVGVFWQDKPLPRFLARASDNPKAVSDKQTPDDKVHAHLHQAVDTGTFRGCSGVTDCAHQESMNLFKKPLDPVRMEEFNVLLYSYLQQETEHFHHWEELEDFVNSFFDKGIFIHNQMLFTDFISDVEDYLEKMDEYTRSNMDIFKDLDKYVYRHFFGNSFSEWYEQSNAERTSGHHQNHPKTHIHLQKDRKWIRPKQAHGRHIADLKIELDSTPFHSKY
ncbi:cell cycle progression protein 1-like isoform X6 [Arapaima gigas]